jgi:YD repeat-containing protein
MTDLAARTRVRLHGSRRRVAWLTEALPADLADTLWSRPESLVELGKPLRNNGRRVTVQLAWGGRQFVLKHYVENSRRHAVKRLIQHSRAWLAWRTSHQLADEGFLTPRPVACVENRWLRLRSDSFIMYPYVDGETLRRHFDGEIEVSATDRQWFWRQYCDLWDRLTERLITLGDGNLSNFIVAPDRRLWVIDLDKTRFHRLPTIANWYRRQRWKQIMRCVTRCERERQQRIVDVEKAAA